MMNHEMSRKEIQEAKEILKPVLKAEKRLQKAAKALVVAKLALAHALVEANVDSNAALSAWTEGVLSGNDAAVKQIYDTLTRKKTAKPAAKEKAAKTQPPLTVIKGGTTPRKPAATNTTTSTPARKLPVKSPAKATVKAPGKDK